MKKESKLEDLDILSTLEPDLVKEIYEDYEAVEVEGDIGLEDFLASPKLQIINDIEWVHRQWVTF